MGNLQKELEDLLDKYAGSMVTEEMKTSLKGDLSDMFDKYLQDFDWDLVLSQDAGNSSILRVDLLVDGGIVCSSSLSELPAYLAHELEVVRESASRRLIEVTNSGNGGL